MSTSANKYIKKLAGYLFQASMLSCFYIVVELLFHFMQGFEISLRLIYPVVFCLPLGFLLTAIFSLFPRKANIVLSIIAMAVPAIWACVQICYSHVFQTYMEINKIFMGGDVVENFGTEMADAIISSIPSILLFVALTVIFSLELALKIKPKKKPIPICIGGIIFAVILHFGCFGLLHIEGTGAYTPIAMYKQNPGILDNNMQNFGLLTSFRLDLSGMLFARSEEEVGNAFKDDDMSALLGPNTETQKPSSEGDSSTGNTENETEIGTENTEPIIPEKTKNVLDIDFDALLAGETNSAITAVHQYVQSQPGSNVNQYTGYFEGYNLIMICAESFTSYMIDEELTPTLYKMSNNGFVFNNFYGTFKSVTTNGEYAFCTGLMPNTVGKTTELKTNSTFMLSMDKYLPYCMGNVFRDMGARTYAYHSNNGDYYKREETHPNMGYDVLRFLDGSYVDGVFDASAKLKYTTKRPNSDEETILQTMPDYLSDKDENGNVKQFHAYYMTYSGHHPYYDVTETDKTRNPMVFQNREIVDALPVSSHVKGYIAANLELENMLTQLLKGLEEAGCLENTVIVVTNDHYPYGLTDKEFRELASFTGKTIESTYGIYENTFICYNAGMEEKVVVDTPCCTVDIIPTLLNLFGVDYDSRLLAGTDVLDPNSFHVAMLYNQSFITDKIKYNTSNGKITYLVDKDTVSQQYIDACINYVQNKFEISLQIISNDYYKIIYDSLEKNQTTQ
ncbi:MAG: LTA synthase family protein [Agathobacter sp.]|nr:LTA synthase family protein [Agathobacter sp.]